MSLLRAVPCSGFALKEACQFGSNSPPNGGLRCCRRERLGRWRESQIFAAGPGGGVLDRPTTKGLPGIDLGKSTTKQRPRSYRVMLHNDDFNRREYVVKVLLKVLDNFTMEDAINCMQEAHTNGVACLVSCPQEDAEKYCEGLRGNGLISSIEPAGGSGSGPEAS
ncbi:g443 [Coccomyxa viridis]|uniref:G443 protein n=1 Tax=Coccomyxa viridis TaxID=1274662 RepID=A0ABP1FHQ5_9CHLO